MRTYYIFNVNKYYSYMYKDNPFKMYKIFEEIYYSRDYDSVKTYHILEEIANPFNKIMLNEYIYFEFDYNIYLISNVYDLMLLFFKNTPNKQF